MIQKFTKKLILKETNNKQAGFALLFSVLLSSILLSIGLSIFNITLKELSISTASRQSIYAFYAADSGREYILYEDIKKGTLMDFPTQTSSSTPQDTFIKLSDSDGPNYTFTVDKEWDDQNTKVKINTTLFVRGYDSTGNDRLERAIEQTY